MASHGEAESQRREECVLVYTASWCQSRLEPGLQTLWLVSHLLYYIVLSKKKQGQFHAKAQVDCWLHRHNTAGLRTSVSRVLRPLGSRLAHSCRETWGIRRSSTGLAWYCPSFLMVHNWTMMAQKFFTVNTWQLVAWGTHLVQIFIIGLLSLRPWRGVLSDQVI